MYRFLVVAYLFTLLTISVFAYDRTNITFSEIRIFRKGARVHETNVRLLFKKPVNENANKMTMSNSTVWKKSNKKLFRNSRTRNLRPKSPVKNALFN